MKCSEVEKQIDFFIDDDFTHSLGEEVELHLNECRNCEKTFESLQVIRKIIKKEVSVPASSRLDGRVLEAFSRHHEIKQKKTWRTFVFGQIVIPKPAFAIALLLFAVFTGLAFQLGKTAGEVKIVMPVMEMANAAPQLSESNLISGTENESAKKTFDAPVIKYIEVPVVKEKIVTRYVYIKQPAKENSIETVSAKAETSNFPLNSSVNENKYATQVNLKEFQPVAEMKIKIIRKGENNEK